MCCQDSKPIFKGVLVSSTIVVALLAVISSTEALTVEKSNSEQDDDDDDDEDYCVYLDGSQELDCVCPSMVHSDSSPLSITNLIDNYVNSNALSIKIHSCPGDLKLRLDLGTLLLRPLYRIRLEDINGSVHIEGATLLKGDNVNLWIRNVHGEAEFSGGINCIDRGCHNDTSLGLEFEDVTDVRLRDVAAGTVGTPSGLRVKVRNADSLTVIDSLFRSLPRDSIEVFNVSSVFFGHSEMPNASAGAVLLNLVTNVTVKDSIMRRASVEMLDAKNRTSVLWMCTVDPDQGYSAGPDCAPGRRKTFSEPDSSAAIVMAVISAVLLLAAVTVLAIMHKNGRLEQYL